MPDSEIKQAPSCPYVSWPSNSPPPKGRWKSDSRICFGIFYFDNEEDAKVCASRVRKDGRTYNGGWFHGMPCGREPSRDYTDTAGVKWYAVTH